MTESKKARNASSVRKQYLLHKEEKKAYAKARYKKLYSSDPKYRAQMLAFSKATKARYKQEVFDHYGRVCECCGETHTEFLTIDHVEGGGNKHRKSLRIDFYRWLVQNKFPEGFRTLCMNCNFSLGRRGYCPHKHASLKRVVA